jgi:enterochelin esterase-like enzyme
MLRRRQLLSHALAAAGTAAMGASLSEPEAHAEGSKHYEVKEIVLGGDKRVGTRFTLLTPKHVGDEKVPLLVLLHGLGETHDQRIGARAWLDRYGLGTAYDRLREPPIEPLYEKSRYWKKKRLKEVNELLADQPFRGLALACPYTPNVYKSPLGRKAVLDKYADWITDVVIPRARKEANVLETTRHTYLDGCSLGGYVGIEVFLRKPQHFGAWGTVQGALGAHRVLSYAKRIAKAIEDHGARRVHVETSTADAFRKVNERFAKALDKQGVKHDFIMPPGPHNQPFLRDSGTVEMLLWHDRLPR